MSVMAKLQDNKAIKMPDGAVKGGYGIPALVVVRLRSITIYLLTKIPPSVQPRRDPRNTPGCGK